MIAVLHAAPVQTESLFDQQQVLFDDLVRPTTYEQQEELYDSLVQEEGSAAKKPAAKKAAAKKAAAKKGAADDGEKDTGDWKLIKPKDIQVDKSHTARMKDHREEVTAHILSKLKIAKARDDAAKKETETQKNKIAAIHKKVLADETKAKKMLS